MSVKTSLRIFSFFFLTVEKKKILSQMLVPRKHIHAQKLTIETLVESVKYVQS